MSNTEDLQCATEADDSLTRNEILTDDKIIRTVTADDDDDDDDVTPVNPVKISHSEAVAALNTSLQWAEDQTFEAHEIMLLRRRDRAFELKIGTAAQKKSLTFLDTDYVHSLTYVVIMYAHIMFVLHHVHSIYPDNQYSLIRKTLGPEGPQNIKPCSHGVWLGNPRVARGSYLWTVVSGIPNSRAVPTAHGLTTEDQVNPPQSVTENKCELRKEVKDIIKNFDSVFSKDKYDVGALRVEPQRIVLNSDLPVSLRPYRTSPVEEEKIESG
ncbi:hypothetical protein AVEN_191317-1 [Araneus ventricosus]|uniref:Uncharacterized protein n=1 Tax=Araneus ventricosus TaxID=182803 RepID=A0A4Y2GIY4_ARAVE|nr:hypothetical protein AVEN_191317-1 [Araneus ventricosus]